MSKKKYAGDKTPQETWDLLAENPNAQMIDVRTDAEFVYVGSPDLSSLGKEPLQVYWKIFPAMTVNPDFVAQTVQALGSGAGKDTPLLFLCRSGIRSLHAAEAMTAAGWTACFNVTSGFEGDKNKKKHRATVNGWQVDGLPWKQK